MTHQEIFNWLSVLECELFYTQRDLPGAAPVHDLVREALEAWHNITGCKNEGGTAHEL